MAFEDLLKDSSFPLDNKNYFNLTITDLKLNETYPLQFRWKYEDGTFGPWSVVKSFTTVGPTVPADPNLPIGNVIGGAGLIKVIWDGNAAGGSSLLNIDRVDIHISGTSFGNGTTPSGSFKTAGAQTFIAEPGSYTVQLKAYTVNGASSFFSTARTVTVTTLGEVIQTPSLPSGLTAVAAPFAVSINWAGTYSVGTFTGFKSIDIFAVSSDLGSTTTSGITNTNLVGSLTVNDTPNKINVGLDNLRQALSLSTNSDAYSATIFFYYLSVNKDNTKYGSPTYTRINSSSVVPTKANFVDLASGVISIENLVAGNGTFSSWLRTGTAGGARIELSAVNNFTNGGYTVKKGLTAYSSGSTETLGFDLSTGALSLSGSLAATSISTSSGKFAVNSSGILTATDANLTGQVTASGGSIGGIIIAADAIQNGSTSGNSTFRLDSTGKARFGPASGGDAIIIETNGNIYHTTNASSNTPSGKFQISGGNLTISGVVTATSGSFTGSITSTSGSIAGFTMDADGLINSGSTLRLFAGTTGINNIYSIYTTKAVRFGEYVVIQGSTGFGSYSLVTEKGMSLANGGLTIDSTGKFSSNATFTDYIYYPGYPISTSGGAARVNDATTPSSRLVAASGSSIRFKENIVNISEKEGLDPSVLLNLPVRSFTYKQGYLPEDDARYGMDLPGFIAEELEEIYPIAVDRDADGTPQRWNADFIIPGLLKIIQTQNGLIESIKLRLDALEG